MGTGALFALGGWRGRELDFYFVRGGLVGVVRDDVFGLFGRTLTQQQVSPIPNDINPLQPVHILITLRKLLSIDLISVPLVNCLFGLV